MTREQLTKRIDSIIKDADRLKKTVCALDVTDMESSPKAYRSLSADAVERAEWLTCRLRHMIYETTRIRKPEYLLRVAEAQGIHFNNRDGVFEIILPGVSPGHSGKRPSEFLTGPMNAALAAHFGKHPIPRYRRCVVCYTLVFDRELPGRACLDTGNPELKLYLDVAASYLLIDDSSKYIDVFHSTELGDRDAFSMAFMERERFSRWLREREQNCEAIGA